MLPDVGLPPDVAPLDVVLMLVLLFLFDSVDDADDDDVDDDSASSAMDSMNAGRFDGDLPIVLFGIGAIMLAGWMDGRRAGDVQHCRVIGMRRILDMKN